MYQIKKELPYKTERTQSWRYFIKLRSKDNIRIQISELFFRERLSLFSVIFVSETGTPSATMSALLSVSNIVEGFFIPLVATFGILGNLASICVLRDNRLEMKATFRQVLCILYKRGYHIKAYSKIGANTKWRSLIKVLERGLRFG